MNRTIWPLRFFDLLQHSFEAVFKLAAILCAGEHGAEVERDDALVAQALGHVAGDDAAGEAFDDGGFAHAGLADEHRVVLGAARKHLDHAANLLVAADDGVELAAAREFGEVLGVFFKRLEFAFGILVGDALRAAHGGERLQNGVVGGAERHERVARRIALLVRDAQQQVLGGDVIVLEVRGFAEGLLERLGERRAETRLRRSACDARQFLLDLVQVALQPLDRHTDLFEHGGDHALAVLNEREQQVDGLQFGVAELGSMRLRLLHRLLRFDSEFLPTNCHVKTAPSF